MNLRPGQIIRFTYSHKTIDKDTGDKFKEVLILHPNWNGKLHGIDLKRLTPAEREVLEAIMDPETRNRNTKHPLPIVNDIIRRMDPSQEIRNPATFYTKFVKKFLNSRDAYRQYYVGQMKGLVIAKDIKISGRVNNPKPLFGDQQPTTGQLNALERQKFLQQRAQAAKSGLPPPRPPQPSGIRPSSPGVASQGVLGTQSGAGAAQRKAALLQRAKKGTVK